MAHPAGRGRLCTRCGALLPPPAPGSAEGAEGTCPECGLGFAWAPLAARVGRPRASLSRWPPAPRWPRPSPRRRPRRAPPDAAERARQVRRCGFPLYGLDASFEGRRWVGGHGASNGVVTEIELAHGDARLDGAPLVRVRTRRANPEAPPGLAAGEAARALAMQLWHEGGAEHGAVRAAFVDDDPVASWEEARVPVAGVPTAFRRLVAGSTWVALGHVGGQLVTLFARHEPVERVRLVRIADPEPYLSGSAAP